MRMVVPAVTWFIENVMVERSDEISQKLSTEADRPGPGEIDWHRPMKLKSRIVVPLLCKGSVLS